MNEKLSFQNIADALSQKAGVSKKVAETFSKAFFDTIVEALYMGEDSIKIKGLGTFKLVEVESRESVNVTNGERIVIPGYKKVSFAPEDSVVELLNKDAETEEEVPAVVASEPVVEEEDSSAEEVKEEVVNEPVEEAEETPVVEEESAPATEDVPAEEEEEMVVEEVPSAIELAPSIDTLIQVPEPAHVEQPQDEFAGIDLLISTPESVDEIRQQYEAAKAKMETAVEEARKANAEKLRLEKLLERLEANMQPESVESKQEEAMQPVEKEVLKKDEEEDSSATPLVSEIPQPTEEQPSPEDKRKEALERFIKGSDEENAAAESKPQKSKKSPWGWIIALVAVLLLVVIFFLYKTSKSIESVEKVPVPTQPEAPKKVAPKDSIKTAHPKDSTANAETKKDSVKVENQQAEESKPVRPATYKIQKGESLTRISQRFYGTKDSVAAIIRANTLADPNNVPVGAVIKLP
ncbi:MAG: HU family DNA-binding protein [Bacteroidaceae bacterium]|nr:HU family DNA-binding protein [Bacteroidaceae bacterium]